MSGGFIVIHRRVSGQQAVLLIDGFRAMRIELKPLAQATVSSGSYQHAIDSGVYLRGARRRATSVTRDEIGNPFGLAHHGPIDGGNHGEARHVARRLSLTSIHSMAYATGHAFHSVPIPRPLILLQRE